MAPSSQEKDPGVCIALDDIAYNHVRPTRDIHIVIEDSNAVVVAGAEGVAGHDVAASVEGEGVFAVVESLLPTIAMPETVSSQIARSEFETAQFAITPPAWVGAQAPGVPCRCLDPRRSRAPGPPGKVSRQVSRDDGSV